MKNLIYNILIIMLALTACSKDLNITNKGVCGDAYIFPEKWSGEDLDNFDSLPSIFFQSMSTCGLLETLFEHPKNKLLGPWCMFCNDLDTPGVSMFNAELRANKAAVELFERSDCFSVLEDRYRTCIYNRDPSLDPAFLAYFGMLLASDLCMEALNENEKYTLMAITMDNNYYCMYIFAPILISIMKSCNYAPFVEDVVPMLHECIFGYTMVQPGDEIMYLGLSSQAIEIILKYSKDFLNEQNL